MLHLTTGDVVKHIKYKVSHLCTAHSLKLLIFHCYLMKCEKKFAQYRGDPLLSLTDTKIVKNKLNISYDIRNTTSMSLNKYN